MPTPQNRGAGLDSFNDQLRADLSYRQFLQSIGVNPDAPVHLNGQQRSAVESFVRQKYPDLAGKFQVDPAGNVNTDHGLSTAWSNPYFRTALIAGGAALTAGMINPALLGLGGAGGAAGGAAAGGAAAGGGVGVGTTAAIAGGGAGIWNTVKRFIDSPVGSQAIDTIGDYFGNKSVADSNTKAAEANERAAHEALDFEKGVYEDDKKFFEPYGAAGQASIARISDLAGQPRTPATAESIFASGRIPNQPPLQEATLPPMRISDLTQLQPPSEERARQRARYSPLISNLGRGRA